MTIIGGVGWTVVDAAGNPKGLMVQNRAGGGCRRRIVKPLLGSQTYFGASWETYNFMSWISCVLQMSGVFGGKRVVLAMDLCWS